MGKRTADITTIVDTISVIAERTNLLSLNASIEAARAGDAGRGFAVVAEEIRNLADRSARATADIAAIIRALQEVSGEAIAASNDGMRIADESNAMAEAGAAGLKKILAGVSETAQLVAQIARATDEQRSAGQAVVIAITATNEQSRQVAAATAEQSAAAGSIVQATSEMRKIAQEVTKAVSEQGRAARDILKAAQATTKLAVQVRKAAAEQTRSVSDITQAADSMRRGAAATSRALAEQAAATEAIVKASNSMAGTVAGVSRTIVEQTAATDQIARATENMRVQSDQAAKALSEQSRAMKDMTAAASNAARQVRLISQGHRQHFAASDALVAQLAELRRVADHHAKGARGTQSSTADLLRHAEVLNDVATGGAPRANGANGRGRGTHRH
jgi:methyl-accepting chemotaxis protein